MELEKYKDKLFEIKKLWKKKGYWSYGDIDCFRYRKSLAELKCSLFKELFKNILSVEEDKIEDFVDALQYLIEKAKKDIKSAEESIKERGVQ